ncbi:MAG: hypothetical protein CGW95_00955 [Phenylobacterium zucineum]|nr:MAG: hypothetical protein CGW95_00955 [Phenylobacterium zucineum]
MRRIEVDFPVDVTLTEDEHRALDQVLTSICNRYVTEHPGRVMWVFGTGQKMLSNPFLVGDDEPLQFDESILHFDIHEREDFMAYKHLKSGDPFTIIEHAPLKNDDGSEVAIGALVSKWFDTSEPGRVFRVTKVTRTDHGASVAYECTFLGMMEITPDPNNPEQRLVRVIDTDGNEVKS